MVEAFGRCYAPRRMGHPDVIVVGGGIIGLAIADELAGRGASVELYEARVPGRGASWAAGGMLGTFSELGPSDPVFELAQASHQLFEDWVSGLSARGRVAVAYRPSGTLLISEPLDHLDLSHLDAAALRGLEPLLADADIPGGYELPDGWLDSRQAITALISSCRARGVLIHEVTTVQSVASGGVVVEATLRPAGLVVVATGSEARDLVDLPVDPVRGQALIVKPRFLPGRVLRWRGGPYLIPRAQQRLFVGATEEPGAGSQDCVTAGGMASLLSAAIQAFPPLAEAEILETFAGLRPATPDRLPLLGRLTDDIWVACGHYRNGILLSPITARVIGDLFESGSTTIDIRAFDPHRFAGERNVDHHAER